jgi:ATP-dependent DNA ligase
MEARLVDALPAGPEWWYEPKWDGFRGLLFRDGREVILQSKSGQDLTRYFPEVVEAARALKPARFVLDGELVIPVEGRISFDDLLMRIHPAASRVKKLAAETPARMIVFDLLVDAKGKPLVDLPLAERRGKLEEFAAAALRGQGLFALSPTTTDFKTARRWLENPKVGLDGVMAKRTDLPYRTGERDGMQKVKRQRTADCVVGGFRYASEEKVVGSLLLGLYNDQGQLNHVGFTSGLTAAQRKELTPKLEKIRKPPGFTGKKPGGPSRWSRAGRSEVWEPLDPKLVVEVQYDHFTAGRFRHGTRLMRWRPDKAPAQCTLDQVRKARGSSLKMLDAPKSRAASR